ncbi:NADH dehydrogenase [ubiquinone] 1 beta subcomplex subunit 6 isoform X2 [Nilaparvata lugens]|uniref:NADH dehydrogenase [ubiquinone] 1 beta subcomplex subunit 6 isoform X1 n=1 Tax=Nilaparvata lugens TaxID=108931 RepID=UPI000B99BB5F|nr:NADH dehydrogenase [ubiquinone] 1 beta subcomplex subunit 6 isoform X1 [Nilaparvata lugens]XP_039278462.1 NADH dehydrogenase [ubiquinone] 1 beta subcomplex subunit 6 isoform X2 [Nilaparvata lugens]
MGYHEPHGFETLTGGVKAMNLEGRLGRERERLLGMSPEERQWRKQWVKDQHLSPNEPRFVPELYKELNNPLRRLYRKPLDMLFEPLQGVLGKQMALNVRYITGRFLMFTFAGFYGAYWLKYNAHTWETAKGWDTTLTRPSILPGEPGFPWVSQKSKPSDYYDKGFKDSPI